MNKENMYVVIKRDDALNYLTKMELEALENLLLVIEQGRASDGKNLSISIMCAIQMNLMHRLYMV